MAWLALSKHALSGLMRMYSECRPWELDSAVGATEIMLCKNLSEWKPFFVILINKIQTHLIN
jgi:hypothetical protein